MNYELEDIRSAMKETVYQGTIRNIRNSLSDDYTVKEIINICLENIVDAAQAVGGTFWYYNRETDFIVPYVVYGGKELVGIKLRPNEGIAGTVIATGEPTLVDNCKQNGSWSATTDSKTGFETKSMICVPVRYMDDIAGCIQLVNHRYNFSFEKKDLEFIQNLSGYVSRELEKNPQIASEVMKNNARVKHSILKGKADAMFELINHPDFDEALDAIEDADAFGYLDEGTRKKFIKLFVKIKNLVE